MIKHLNFLLMICLTALVLASCQPDKGSGNELPRVKSVYKSYFDGIASFDYEKMRNVCTPDCKIYENGAI